MNRIRTRMEYKEIVSVLGKPCFESSVGPDSPARAWRTADRTRGLYVEFSGSEAVAIADFDREALTLRKGGRFAIYIMDGRDYRRRVVDLLKAE